MRKNTLYMTFTTLLLLLVLPISAFAQEDYFFKFKNEQINCNTKNTCTSSHADINNDNIVNEQDIITLQQNYNTKEIHDQNDDDDVSLEDLALFANLISSDLEVTPSFHAISVYLQNKEYLSQDAIKLYYKKSSGIEYKRAHDMVKISTGEFTSSIVNLDDNTKYDILVTYENQEKKISITTLSNTFPIAKTIYVEDSSTPLIIAESGTKDGYILYTSKKQDTNTIESEATDKTKATIDVNKNFNSNIEIINDASYIIIDDLNLINANKNAILFKGKSTNIIIQNNHIFEWGNANQNGFATDSQAAIYANKNPIKKIIIQNNKIYNPTASTNRWGEYREDKKTSHPFGPKAIHFTDSLGSHVIRYNEIFSTNNNYFEDAIGGGQNFGEIGFPYKDSDIYGNYITNVYDDAIEAEGANTNIRIYNNFIENVYVPIAISPVTTGPVYIFNNIALHSSNTLESGPFIKAGQKQTNPSGPHFIYHNTVIKQGKGYSGAIVTNSDELYHSTSKNNIYHLSDHSSSFKDNTNSCTNQWDYDIYNTPLRNDCEDNYHQQNGFYKRPIYQTQDIIRDQNNVIKKAFILPIDSFQNKGTHIPNFNNEVSTMGAFASDSEYMEFGVKT